MRVILEEDSTSVRRENIMNMFSSYLYCARRWKIISCSLRVRCTSKGKGKHTSTFYSAVDFMVVPGNNEQSFRFWCLLTTKAISSKYATCLVLAFFRHHAWSSNDSAKVQTSNWYFARWGKFRAPRCRQTLLIDSWSAPFGLAWGRGRALEETMKDWGEIIKYLAAGQNKGVSKTCQDAKIRDSA